MDSEAGRFVSDKDAKEWMTRYDIGEVVKVKDNEFEIEEIRDEQLILRPLSTQDRQGRALSEAFGGAPGIARLRALRRGPLGNRHEQRKQDAEVKRTFRKNRRRKAALRNIPQPQSS